MNKIREWLKIFISNCLRFLPGKIWYDWANAPKYCQDCGFEFEMEKHGCGPYNTGTGRAFSFVIELYCYCSRPIEDCDSRIPKYYWFEKNQKRESES